MWPALPLAALVILATAAWMLERRRARRAQIEAAARTAAIAGAVPDALFVVDHDARITFANRAAADVFDRSDLVGRGLETILTRAAGTSLGPGPIPFPLGSTCDALAIRPDGSTLPISCCWWSYETARGPIAFAGIVHDRSEEDRVANQIVRASADLERTNQELAEFASIASHDLAEPLRMISSFLNLLTERSGDQLDDEARSFIGYAVDGAERLDALVRDLLAYSRAGTTALDRRALGLRTVAQEAVDLLRNEIRETRAQVWIDELPSVDASPALIGQVLQHLLRNALTYHAHDAPPRIEVTWRPGTDAPVVRVIDHGIGIPDEHVERVFEPFRRLHTRDRYPGTGIGLAICRKIIERHGGRIWIEPTEGGGTTVGFAIPPVAAPRAVRGVA